MEAYLEVLDLWKAVEEDYNVLPLPNNLIITQIKKLQRKKSQSLSDNQLRYTRL